MITRLVLLMGLMGLVPLTADGAPPPPREIAGFALDAEIDQATPRLKPETTLAIRFAEYLQEVETQPIPGFKSGLITYGSCSRPGRIVRIKLKYEDSSRKFFDALLERFQARFGEPDEWRGDPFHVVIDWKWSFRDAEGNSISLHLQHNNRDADDKVGNAVKLTAISAIEDEAACFQRRFPEFRPPDAGSRDTGLEGEKNWENLLPR